MLKTTYIGLYYPFIHFQDDEWLKLAALYWPRVARIVPPGYATSDSDTVKRLAGDLDFVRNVSPGAASVIVGPLFAEFLQRHEGALRDRYGVDRADELAPDPVTIQRMELGQSDTSMEARLAHIYASKVAPGLLERLSDSGLAVRARGPNWIGVHPKLASVYMAALTEEIATRNHLEPMTDDTVNHLATSGWDMSRLAEALLDEPGLAVTPASPEELSARLAFITFRSVVPDGPLDVAKVIRVRELYERERGKFVGHLRALAEEIRALGDVEDAEALAAHLGAVYDATVGQEVLELKRAINSVGVDTAFSAMNLRLVVPRTLATAAVIAGVTLDPVVALGGALVYAAADLTRTQRSRTQLLVEDSPAGYLLRLERALEPLSLLGRIRAGISRFLRGV